MIPLVMRARSSESIGACKICVDKLPVGPPHLTLFLLSERDHQNMSRLIILNLPPTITPSSLRTQLTQPSTLKDATITDLKVNTKRRFAFVGYKTVDDAEKARKWFDGSFALGGGKVKVDFVRDEPLAPKPKRAKIDQNLKVESQPQEQPDAGPSKQLQEWMDVMKGKDSSVPGGSAGVVPGEEGWVADGLQKDGKKLESKKGKGKAEEVVEAEDEAENDDDAAWLRKRQTAQLAEAGSAAETVKAVDAEKTLILSTGRLFVRNLAFSVTSEDLSAHFSRYGHIESVHLPVSQSGEPLGTAYVLFRDPADAFSAYLALDKTTFQGRLLHVLPGRARPGQEVKAEGVGEVQGGVLGKVKQGHEDVIGKADAKKKADNAKGVNWATLYMNSDAVAASVADRMGISKSELLAADPSSSSVSSAVKLALAETHVIAETKQYFADAGLNVDSLQPRTPRSQTILLVKNIPYGTSIHTLTDMFSAHGETTRILLPPAGTIGVVEYKLAEDAGRAFKALSYKRIGNAVLYLEKGPTGMFNAPAGPSAAELDLAEKAALAERVAQVADAPAEGDEAGSTLFLKNLSWNTTTQRLQAILSTLAGFSFARVQTKPDPKRPGEKLSMGYGFVGFKTRQDAQKALGGLEGFEIDGKALEVKFAQRGAEDVDDDGAKKKGGAAGTKSTKMLVKNLPFEISKKEVRELFAAYGTVKSLRLPKKPVPTATGAQSTRGFAFLEFTTHAEALRAMEALKHTHLLGRHLVLEWAREGEGVDVDKLREKVKTDARAGTGGGPQKGKRKLDLGLGGDEDALDAA